MKGRRSFFPVKQASPLVVLAALFALLLCLGYGLTRLGYFNIRYIICDENLPIDLSYLKGRNIFGVNLKKESLYLAGLYPGYKSVRLVKVFPDRIFVEMTCRRPLAYVKLFKYFCVDDGLVLFDIPKEAQEAQFPLILGLERRISNPRLGVRVNSRELAMAVTIIKETRQNPVLRDYPIKRIDVPGLNNASFFIAEGLQVKISQDDIKAKMLILGSLLNEEKDNLDKVGYIDLRFKEPVIKLKSAD
jgi:cell division septal protein FtsQ